MSGSRPAAILIAALSLLPGAARAQKKAPAAYGIVEGTVFRDPGFALPEAKVVLLRRGGDKEKKLQEAVSNYRGEFLFRVPPAEATYIVRASLKGYRSQEKEAAVSGEERVEVNLVLSPENK